MSTEVFRESINANSVEVLKRQRFHSYDSFIEMAPWLMNCLQLFNPTLMYVLLWSHFVDVFKAPIH